MKTTLLNIAIIWIIHYFCLGADKLFDTLDDPISRGWIDPLASESYFQYYCALFLSGWFHMNILHNIANTILLFITIPNIETILSASHIWMIGFIGNIISTFVCTIIPISIDSYAIGASTRAYIYIPIALYTILRNNNYRTKFDIAVIIILIFNILKEGIILFVTFMKGYKIYNETNIAHSASIILGSILTILIHVNL